MFPGIRSFLVFSILGFKPPASGFQFYSYSSLKTSPSIQHRLENIFVNVEKILHSEVHPERSTELHRDEKREEGDRRGGVKRVETNQACNHFPKYSPQPRSPREIPRVK